MAGTARTGCWSSKTRMACNRLPLGLDLRPRRCRSSCSSMCRTVPASSKSVLQHGTGLEPAMQRWLANIQQYFVHEISSSRFPPVAPSSKPAWPCQPCPDHHETNAMIHSCDHTCPLLILTAVSWPPKSWCLSLMSTGNNPLAWLQVYVMGPITILVRRPSLRLPVATGDLEEEVGGIQSVGRVSAYHSESEFGSAPQGDPPHWAIQALAQHLRRVYKLTLFNFDLIQPDSSQDYGTDPCHSSPPALYRILEMQC